MLNLKLKVDEKKRFLSVKQDIVERKKSFINKDTILKFLIFFAMSLSILYFLPLKAKLGILAALCSICLSYSLVQFL
jgi:hypothetical protein